MQKEAGYFEILKSVEQGLAEAGIEDSKTDAWLLFEFVTGLKRTEYFLKMNEVMPKEQIDRLLQLAEERKKHIPLQHITGSQEFMGLEFIVTPDVLIPRYDTERLVEEVIKVSEGKSVLDLCTGSGCIALSILKLGNPTGVTASDISDKALDVAKKNYNRLFGDFSETTCNFLHSDMFKEIDSRFDIIVSNPPYIKPCDIKELMPEVRDFEPYSALDGGEDGLDFYRIIAKEAESHLNEGGMLFLEIGYDQGDDVTKLLEACGYHDISVIKDYAGLDRVVKAARNGVRNV